MTGMLHLGEIEAVFECLFFATVDEVSSRLASLVERAVWGELIGDKVYD